MDHQPHVAFILYNTVIDCYLPYVFLKFVFLAALASWLCRLHSFWLFMADEFVQEFWAAIFFSGPSYVVNSYCLLSDELRINIRYAEVKSQRFRGRFYQYFMSNFYALRFQKHKKYSQTVSLFALLKSAFIKALHKTLMKLA